MREIKLSQFGKNKGKYAVLVNDEDFEYLDQFKWSVIKFGRARYACKCANKKTILMHRVIMKTPKELQVDHIDHNGLNNQRSNLRNCTRRQNAVNVVQRSATGYKGVYYCNGKIRVSISVNGKVEHLGFFKTEKEAASAYDKKAKEVHGVFANLNFITV